MKYILVASWLLAVSVPAFAVSPKINQGDWEVNGSMNFSHYDSGYGRNSFSLAASGQKFIVDDFSLGLDGSFYAYASNTWTSIGPIATKYLWVHESTAPYLSLLPIVVSKSTSSSYYFYSRARAGVKFFLTDSVAVGPAVEMNHSWPKSGSSSTNYFSFLGLFSIHL